VGYDVAFCASGLKLLPELGTEVFLHIFTKVREDAIELFGFGRSVREGDVCRPARVRALAPR